MNEIVFAPYHDRWLKKPVLKRLIWTAAGSCALGGLYAWKFGDHWIRVERRDMHLSNLGKGFQGARIAHISDLHCSPIVLQKYLRQCVEEINGLHPDFVVMTGDFITGHKQYARRVATVLKHLRPKVASLAVLGNHDYGIFHPRGLGGPRGLAEYLSGLLTQANVQVMLNDCRAFTRDGDWVQFVGVEDLWSPRFNPFQAFETARANVPTVALCHNPDAAPQLARGGAQWTLAGHTHGTGLPEVVLPSDHPQFLAGQYDLGNDHWLYVNRGIGYGRRRNLNCRPEITLFTLRCA